MATFQKGAWRKEATQCVEAFFPLAGRGAQKNEPDLIVDQWGVAIVDRGVTKHPKE